MLSANDERRMKVFEDRISYLEKLLQIEPSPEPMEFWVNVYPDGFTSLYKSEDTARLQSKPGRKTIKVREVTDE